MKNGETNRFSVITILIFIIILVSMIVYLVLSAFGGKEENIEDNSSNTTLNQITNIEGNEYIKIEEGAKINVSEMLQNDKFLDEFVFNDFYVYSIDGATRIDFEVTNESSYRKNLDKFKFVIYTDTEKVGEISCTGEEISAKQTKKLNVVVNADIANLYDIKVEKIYTNEM